MLIVFDKGLRQARDDGFAHAPEGVNAPHNHRTNPDVSNLSCPNGVKPFHQRPACRPTVNEPVHRDEDAKTEHATEENERGNAYADDVPDREKGNGKVHASVNSG